MRPISVNRPLRRPPKSGHPSSKQRTAQMGWFADGLLLGNLPRKRIYFAAMTAVAASAKPHNLRLKSFTSGTLDLGSITLSEGLAQSWPNVSNVWRR